MPKLKAHKHQKDFKSSISLAELGLLFTVNKFAGGRRWEPCCRDYSGLLACKWQWQCALESAPGQAKKRKSKEDRRK